MKIVMCVPNFSEGKDQKIIEAILGEIREVEGVKILSFQADADHNRLDVSYLGEPDFLEIARDFDYVADSKAFLADFNQQPHLVI